MRTIYKSKYIYYLAAIMILFSTSFIQICHADNGEGAIPNISEPNNPDLYKPIATVPAGFHLENTVIVKLVKDEIRRYEWSLAENEKDLIVKKTETTPVKEAEKYSDSIKQKWYRDDNPKS